MDDLKIITAGNIINLRTAKGMTQAELGELLSYSDKSVSKWERAEAVPDAYVLKKMSEIFGVTVDYILSPHDEWVPPKKEKKEHSFSSGVITAIIMIGIWTLALLIYVVAWILEANWWLVFIYAVPVSFITLLVLNSVWEEGRNNRFLVFAMIASIFLAFYLTFLKYDFWQIMLLLIPAEIIAYLSFKIKKSKKSHK